MLKQDIKTVLFDLDGTLVDSLPALTYALNLLCKAHGQPMVSTTQVRPVISVGTHAIIACGFPNTPDLSVDSVLHQQYLTYYAENISQDTQVFAGFDQVFTYLDQQNIPWGVVTNKLSRLSKALLDALDLTQNCAVLMSGDDAARPKPYPDTLLAACQQLKVRPEHCVYVGDAAFDIQAGKRAGMSTVIARYGYIHAEDNPENWAADAEIHAPVELIDLLNQPR